MQLVLGAFKSQTTTLVRFGGQRVIFIPACTLPFDQGAELDIAD